MSSGGDCVAHVPEIDLDPADLGAVIFDVDGTLYSQGSLRRHMAMRLIHAHLTRPLVGIQTFRALEAYRKAQEHLRDGFGTPYENLAETQLRIACERSGSRREFVGACVERWMEKEPLHLLATRTRPELKDFLDVCHKRGLKLGVLSDYPAREKLVALGVDRFFDVIVSAQSPDIGVFKPHARGLLVVADRLGVPPAACLYVGDRAGIDDAAAAAAGMPCVLVGRELGFDALRQAFDAAQPVLDPR